MGRALSHVGNPLKALPPYEQALPIMRKVGDRMGEATILNEMGQAYRAVGQQQQAWELGLFDQAEQIILEAESQLIKVIALDETIDHPDLEKDRATLDRVRAVQRGDKHLAKTLMIVRYR